MRPDEEVETCIRAFNNFSSWEPAWSREGTLLCLCTRWENLDSYRSRSCWTTRHQPASRCTPGGLQNHPVRRRKRLCLFDSTRLETSGATFFVINGQKTYLAESFVCTVAACTDDIGRKIKFNLSPLLPTDLQVHDGHVDRVQLIDRFTLTYCPTPSGYPAVWFVFYLHVTVGKLNRFDAFIQSSFPRQLETHRETKGHFTTGKDQFTGRISSSFTIEMLK